MMNNKKFNFKTLWLREHEDSTSAHQLFLKEHNVKNQEEKYIKGQTLFVLNIPPTATEDSVKCAFSQDFKSVRSVTFATHFHPPFITAFIVFDRESDLRKILSLPREYTFTLYTNDNPGLFGIRKWCKEYNDSLENEDKLKEEIEIFMEEYDKKIAEEKEKENEEQKDEDGWVMVTGRKKRGKYATTRKESVISKLQNKKEEKKKKQLLNFYTFQIRESKKQNIVELRKKFELDKMKLQQYKQKRKFNPF